MTTWCSTALHRAVNAVARSGERDIIPDLERLIEVIESNPPEACRIAAIDEALIELEYCDSIEYLMNVVKRFLPRLGLSHCEVRICREGPGCILAVRAASTFPKEWMEEYFQGDLWQYDPVHAEGVDARESFFWDEIGQTSPFYQSFFDKMAMYAVGRSGYSELIDTKNGTRVIVSVTSHLDGIEMRRKLAYDREDYCQLLRYIGYSFLEIAAHRPKHSSAVSRMDLTNLRQLIHSAEDIVDEMRAVHQTFSCTSILRAIAEAASSGDLSTAPISELEYFKP